jgi:probable rRNA maturation factor
MEINVLVDESLEDFIEVDWLGSVAKQVLVAQKAGSEVELGLVITTQARVQQLNLSYRGRDEPTDVLAFSATAEIGTDAPPFVMPPDGVFHLGEVIISYPQAIAQAEEQRHSVKREIAILIIHGILHLLGYEHDKPELERQMSARAEEILDSIEDIG